MISVKNLKKTFGTNRVLRDIDVEIEEGEIVVVVGSSGSGKSTFLRCLNLLEEPTSGEIIVDGVKITDPHVNLNALRQNIGMVFQQFNLFPNLSVIENIKLAPKKLRKFSDQKATKLARSLLDDVGLLDKADASPNSLSGGQKQRVCIARAIVNQPKVIFADEPTGNLDSVTGEKIERILFGLNKKVGITLIIVTHDEDLAAKCGRIIRIADGHIIADSKDTTKEQA
jgi:ABC-type polar amino acid transport system ATPase subunit